MTNSLQPRRARRPGRVVARGSPPRARLRVLHIAAELFPWVKTGGLGDVIAALPPALAALDVEVRLLLPGFTSLIDALPANEVVRLRTPFLAERVRVTLAHLPGSAIPLYLVDHSPFYDRPGGPYQDAGGADWPDNHRRFALLGWVATALAGGADPQWRPDIVHGHDWHAGLVPAYLRAAGAAVPSIFTVHNLAYGGRFAAATFGELALPTDFFAIDGVEFHGGVSLLKAGLFYADRLTTVSPTYAREIQTAGFGMGFEGLLRARADRLTGILNGVDPAVWSPQHDRLLPLPYGVDDAPAGKAAAKAALEARFRLTPAPEAPLFGTILRLTWQKGVDLLLAALPGLAALGGRLVVLGSGDSDLEAGLAAAAQSRPGQVGVVLGYDEALSHLIVAGSDAVPLPSRFEPCGLTQLYALRYGALPLVRRTGGYSDTVVDANAVTLADGSATGFAFDEATPETLLQAFERAVALYQDRKSWHGVMRVGMTQDFSWEASARHYLALYRQLAAAEPN